MNSLLNLSEQVSNNFRNAKIFNEQPVKLNRQVIDSVVRHIFEQDWFDGNSSVQRMVTADQVFAFINPKLAYDIFEIIGFIGAPHYPFESKIPQEIGQLGNCRFLVNNNADINKIYFIGDIKSTQGNFILNIEVPERLQKEQEEGCGTCSDFDNCTLKEKDND